MLQVLRSVINFAQSELSISLFMLTKLIISNIVNNASWLVHFLVLHRQIKFSNGVIKVNLCVTFLPVVNEARPVLVRFATPGSPT